MRLFIGLPLETAEQETLWQATQSFRAQIKANYVPPSLYHLTLAYLGERETETLHKIAALLSDYATRAERFQITITHADLFCHASRTILYAGIQENASLARLACDIRNELRLLGERFDEAPFVPHITLARKAVVAPPAAGFPLPPMALQVKDIALFHSTRVQDKLTYIPIIRAPLCRLTGELS